MNTNPFSQLIRRAAPKQARDQLLDAKPGTRTHELLRLIREYGRATTATLAFQMDIAPNLVWGLLKYPRDRGSVRFAAGKWELVPGFPGADVQKAVELLRGKGYRVEAPR